MSQSNAMLVRRAIDEIWNRGNYALLGEIAADDIVIHASPPGEDIQGHAGIVQSHDALRRPELRIDVRHPAAMVQRRIVVAGEILDERRIRADDEA